MSRANSDFDPEALRASLDIVRETVCRYFRLEARGGENIPSGRCMIVGCHSGVIPYDAACALVAIEEATGRLARSVGDHLWGRIEAVDHFLRRRGVVIGDRKQAAALLRGDNILLVMPGGAVDMTRLIWRDRYRVLAHKGFAPGRGGYVKIALQTRTPIVPMAVVGAEEAHMMLYNVRSVAEMLGFPFVPIVAFPLPLPVKMYIRFGKPIHLREGPKAARDQALVDRINRRVRRALQALIDDTVERRHGVIWSRYENSSRRRAGR